MKYCKNCGTENNDENVFCFNCRCESFNQAVQSGQPGQPGQAGQPGQPALHKASAPMYSMPVPPPVYMVPEKSKTPLGIFELLTVLGFVCPIVGMFRISMILHPIGVISSIIGFVQGKRYRGLALAGTVISVVGGIIYLVISLYHNGVLPEWITFGAIH